MTRPQPRRHDGGFVLPVALLVLVLLSMISATGLYVARSDYRAAAVTRQAAIALATADAGAALTVATWGQVVPALPPPGTSLILDWQTLPDGSLYRSVVERAPIGAGESAAPRVLMHTTGRVAPPGDARRTVAILVEVTGGPGLCCTAAVKVGSRLRISGPKKDNNLPDVDGTDQTPPGWSGAQCTAPTSDLPGTVTSDASGIDERKNGDVAGSPPIVEDPTLTPADFTTFGGTTYADLAALADASFTTSQTLRNKVGPVVAGGTCDTTDPLNWGSPLTPNGPCGGYFPLVHVAGNLRLQGAGQGQGILLVDGDLQIDDDFEFYGVVIVLGVLKLNGPGQIFGALMVRGGPTGTGRSDLAGGGRVVYSSCAAQRAMESLPPSVTTTGGTSAQQSSWFEVIG